MQAEIEIIESLLYLNILLTTVTMIFSVITYSDWR